MYCTCAQSSKNVRFASEDVYHENENQTKESMLLFTLPWNITMDCIEGCEPFFFCKHDSCYKTIEKLTPFRLFVYANDESPHVSLHLEAFKM